MCKLSQNIVPNVYNSLQSSFLSLAWPWSCRSLPKGNQWECWDPGLGHIVVRLPVHLPLPIPPSGPEALHLCWPQAPTLPAIPNAPLITLHPCQPPDYPIPLLAPQCPLIPPTLLLAPQPYTLASPNAPLTPSTSPAGPLIPLHPCRPLSPYTPCQLSNAP